MEISHGIPKRYNFLKIPREYHQTKGIYGLIPDSIITKWLIKIFRLCSGIGVVAKSIYETSLKT